HLPANSFNTKGQRVKGSKKKKIKHLSPFDPLTLCVETVSRKMKLAKKFGIFRLFRILSFLI
ncbi:MAG: hypothetical protein L0226_08305, partial [Acidobacteria bacterium]|nr:hypothetical protein [Acidobacteriota bacterium]